MALSSSLTLFLSTLSESICLPNFALYLLWRSVNTSLLNPAFGNVNKNSFNVDTLFSVGTESLFSNTTASNNTAVGYQAGYSNTTGIENVAVGESSFRTNTTGSYNTAVGKNAMYYNTTGINNTAIGCIALQLNTTGTNNSGIGFGAEVPSATSNNQVRIGNQSVTYAGVQVAWTITSDKRWKSDIKNSELGLDFVKKLRPVSYFRNNDESKKLEYGFIAQEIEEALNNAGASNNGIISKDDKGMYGVRYNDLMSPIVKAIQEQQQMIEMLKQENKLMQEQIEELKKNK